MSAQLPIIPFVTKSKDDLEKIGQFVTQAKQAQHVLGKRPLGALHYRTRSFQSYKLPRMLKKGSLLKQRIQSKKNNTSMEPTLKNTQAIERCRKHRRRKPFLTAVYCDILATNSQNEKLQNQQAQQYPLMRLSSHLWHRKRFVMRDRYGVMTAQHSSFHGFKAIDGYSKREKTFVHDQSYLRPLELRCSRDAFMHIFQHLMDPGSFVFQQWCGFRSFQAAEYRVLLHEPDKFPLAAIGPVQLCVRDESEKQTNSNNNVNQFIQSWLWCDPSIVGAVQDAIQSVIATAGLIIERLAHVENALSRFIFTGHSATNTLRSMLVDSLADPSSPSARIFIHGTSSTQRLNNIWKNGRILALEAIDRRGGAAMTVPMEPDCGQSLMWPTRSAESPLWGPKSQSSTNRPLHHQISVTNEKSSISKSIWMNVQKQLQTANEDKELDMSDVVRLLSNNKEAPKFSSVCPLLLVRHRWSASVGSVHEQMLDGWSVIVPCEWATYVLCASTVKGAVVIGVEELEHLNRIKDVLSFPRDFPDTSIGEHYWRGKESECATRISKLPRGKRCSRELTTLQVFCQHKESNRDVTTVRNKVHLQAFVLPRSSVCLNRDTLFSIENTLARARNLPHTLNSDVVKLPPLPHLTLVHCKVLPLSRGVPNAGSAIFAPVDDDILQFVKHHVKHKRKIEAKDKKHEASAFPKSWEGVHLTGSSVTHSRILLGTVTSGFHKHCNRTPQTGAIAICDIEMLHSMMCSHYEMFGHPSAHKIVLFKSPGSNFLRPALIGYL